MQNLKGRRPTSKRRATKFTHEPPHASWTAGFVVGVSLMILVMTMSAVQAIQSTVPRSTKTDVVTKSERYVIATAYSSTPDQTDDTPCHTADQYDLCQNNLENVIANNGLPFGTLVRFPDQYGDQLFVVHDRMNARYGPERIDLWMRDRKRAQQFGVKRMRMEIVEYVAE